MGVARDDSMAFVDEAGKAEPEPEKDEPESTYKLKTVKHDVCLNEADSTPDVFFSSRGVVSSLSQDGFEHLLSGVRANIGMKAGRYLFEVKVIGRVEGADCQLRVGFSAAGSSLFLGDGSADSLCFDNEGSYYAAEPHEKTSRKVEHATERLKPKKTIGMLLNHEKNCVSVFLDGVRMGKPRTIPPHLRGKALYPTITFKNITMLVNLGRNGEQLAPLPFKCRCFGDMAEAHHESKAVAMPKDGKREVVIPVGLPDEGLFAFVDRFLEEHPDFEELSARRLLDWCTKSGLKRIPGDSDSMDRPMFNFGPQVKFNGKAARSMLETLARLGGRNCIVAEVQGGLLSSERKRLLAQFPVSVKRTAIVAIGEPPKAFKAETHKKMIADYEKAKVMLEKRKDIADSLGDTLPEKDLVPPAQPVTNDKIWFTPRSGAPETDVSSDDVAMSYSSYCLPDKAEGFEKVDYAWLSKEKCDAHLRGFVLAKKANVVVQGLEPGQWFTDKLKAWKEVKRTLQSKHKEHVLSMQKMKEQGEEPQELTIKPTLVDNIHDADGKGTPLYGNFRFEDWVLLSFRYELHLLAYAFAMDVNDADRPSIPEAHVAHYYNVYFKTKLDPAKVSKKTFEEVLKVLKGPCELTDKVLKSKLDKETNTEDFVKGIEEYRRDRFRRMDAGDESARLDFPRPDPAAAKAGAKAGPPAVKAGVNLKRPASLGDADETPAKKLRPEPPTGPPGKAAVSKAPVAKAPVSKAPVAKRKPA